MNFDNDSARRLLVMFGTVCDETCNKYNKMVHIPEEKREELKYTLLNNRGIPAHAEDYFMTAVLGASDIAREKSRSKITGTDVVAWFTGNGHNSLANLYGLESCKGFKGKVSRVDGDKVSIQTSDGIKICEPLFYRPKVGESVAIHHHKIICSV